MRRFQWARVAAGALGLFLIFAPQGRSWAQAAKPQMSVSGILSGWADALGGVDALKQIKTVHTTGTTNASGLSGPFEDWYSSAGKHRFTLDLSGIYHVLQVFDGKNGWILDNSGPVRELSGPELEDEISQDYIGNGEFLASDSSKQVAKFLGMSDDGTAYIVEIDPPGGKPMQWYLDVKTFLPVREMQHEGSTDSITTFDDWRVVNGVKFSFHQHQTILQPHNEIDETVKELDVNPAMDAALFEKPEQKTSNARLTSPGGTAEIPIEIFTGHIYARARINDSQPDWFVLDSGDGFLLVSQEIARALHVQSKGEAQGGGYGSGSMAYSMAKDLTLKLPGAEISGLMGVISPLASFKPRLGHEMGGIFGYDLLSRFVVEVDYADKKLILHDPDSFHYGGSGTSIPVEIVERLPAVSADLVMPGKKKVEGKFLFDCGDAGTLTIYKPFADSHQLVDRSAKGITLVGGGGVGGESHTFYTRAKAFEIGGYSISSPVTGFNLDKAGAGRNRDFAGGIGFGIMKRFNVIFDYPHQRIILEPNRYLRDPDRFNASGLVILAKGEKMNRFIVERVLPRSPGAAAGIREGDSLIAINHRPANQMTLDDVQRLFRDAGKTYPLTVQRGGKKINLRIKLRELI